MEYKMPTYGVFLILALFCTSVSSAGIELERQNTTNQNIYAYVGSKTYSQINSTIMIEEVTGTFDLLQAKLERDGVSKAKRPGLVSALSTSDGKIYFASSMKGAGEVPGAVAEALGIDQRVIDTLNACMQATPGGTGTHCNQGKCGEIMVMSHWYKVNGANAALPATGKLIVSYNQIGTYAPCRHEAAPSTRCPGFGCKAFLTRLGFGGGEIIPPEAFLEGTEVVQDGLDVTQVMFGI